MTPRGSSDIAPRGLTVIREHTLHFVKHLMSVLGDGSHDPVEVLIQHVALRVPERAEFRHKASLAIVDLMHRLPTHVTRRIVHWFFRWAHAEKVAHRQFALEVMGKLLLEGEKDDDVDDGDKRGDDPQPQVLETIPEAPDTPAAESQQKTAEEGRNQEEGGEEEEERKVVGRDLVSHKFIFGVIFSRCRDVSATVRAKALQTLAEITAAKNPTMDVVIRNLIHAGGDDGDGENGGGPAAAAAVVAQTDSDGMIDFATLLESNEDWAAINPLPSTDTFLDFLRKRALDESVYVRKSALQVSVGSIPQIQEL